MCNFQDFGRKYKKRKDLNFLNSKFVTIHLHTTNIKLKLKLVDGGLEVELININ